ncbi:MAG TPA: phosphoribosylamine--glycine ligase [Gammaproteobacteria bacterium]
MRVLIIGSGGREHALAWKIAQSSRVREVLVAPGNAGTAIEPRVRNVPIAASDIDGLAAFAEREKIDLTIVGPEQPLVAGIVDRFDDAGLRCLGPTAAAARLEGSKAFAKDFLQRHKIPTAQYARFTKLEPALEYLRKHEVPIVVKADGLAAGKGVIVAQDRATAEQAVRSMLAAHEFGAAGDEIVIEEFLKGEEASFIALVAEGHVLPLASSQDHKTRDDGDRGPNTGGMGAYSPAPVVTPAVHERIMREIMLPTVQGLAAEGIAYRGFIYAGVMIDAAGQPRVLEFNCRFGDPETQPILCRLKSDFLDLCLACFEGRLARTPVEWDPRAAVGVVMASRGYPGPYQKGYAITGLGNVGGDSVKIFHAGTRLQGEQVVTDGGRVLCAVGLGRDVADARARVYAEITKIRWDGAFWRTDIGHRALARAEH